MSVIKDERGSNQVFELSEESYYTLKEKLTG